MYSGFTSVGATQIKGFWETDGTEAGTHKFLPTSYPGNPFVFNNTVFFQNTDATAGVELWAYTPTGGTGINDAVKTNDFVTIYPNPSSGKFQISSTEIQLKSLEIFNVLGEKVYSSTKPYVINSTIDISNQPIIKNHYHII